MKVENMKVEKANNPKKIDPRVKDILLLLSAGAILTTSILMPGTALVFKQYLKYKKEKEFKDWEKFNIWRLKQLLKRLQKQKIINADGDQIVITNKGFRRILKYDMEYMALRKKTDGKWRIIIYDIANMKRQERDYFRRMLKKLQLLQLQKSVYLTPFICEDEIEYLRQRFNIGNDVMVLKVAGIENESAYKTYFGV